MGSGYNLEVEREREIGSQSEYFLRLGRARIEGVHGSEGGANKGSAVRLV